MNFGHPVILLKCVQRKHVVNLNKKKYLIFADFKSAVTTTTVG
jgi:hypothetical protein